MSQRQHLYDGKAKTIFAGPDDAHLIQYFKDDATAYNALKHDVIAGKGILNNLISEHIMGHVADDGVETISFRSSLLLLSVLEEAKAGAHRPWESAAKTTPL